MNSTLVPILLAAMLAVQGWGLLKIIDLSERVVRIESMLIIVEKGVRK